MIAPAEIVTPTVTARFILWEDPHSVHLGPWELSIPLPPHDDIYITNATAENLGLMYHESGNIDTARLPDVSPKISGIPAVASKEIITHNWGNYSIRQLAYMTEIGLHETLGEPVNDPRFIEGTPTNIQYKIDQYVKAENQNASAYKNGMTIEERNQQDSDFQQQALVAGVVTQQELQQLQAYQNMMSEKLRGYYTVHLSGAGQLLERVNADYFQLEMAEFHLTPDEASRRQLYFSEDLPSLAGCVVEQTTMNDVTLPQYGQAMEPSAKREI